MSKRKSISKRLRFEIFKRDSFTCQYCGSHPPQVVLHVDHVIPVAEGGGNDEDNLVTSCDTCNLGKGARSLTDVPRTLASKAAEVAEREAQIRGYSEIMAEKRQRIEDECWEVAELWMDQFCPEDDRRFRKDWFQSIKRFIEKLGVHECISAMEIAISRRPDYREHCFKYFCGICWKIIKEDQ